MIKATTFDNMVRSVAKFLDAYSGLAPERILNADSIRGTDLSEMISSSQSYSIKAGQSFLLFEFVENQEDNYVTTGSVEGSMDTIQSYDLHLMIYGNSSPNDAQKLSTIFKTETYALSLREEGIFVKGVAPIEAVNEFINNTWILRRDLIVKTQIRFEFSPTSDDPGVFDETQKGNLIVVNVANA